jgi:flavin reductase (DIM6/NTAB) family NADH-FMN oxidoreductase RutF
MAKVEWKPGTMVYPVPAIMVTCGDMENSNIITVSWTGTVCTDPAMTYVSVRKERHSHGMIKERGEFVINLTTEDIAFASDFCGVKSGSDVDKFSHLGLTKVKGSKVSCPLIGEAPVSIECRVKEVIELGSHDMFLAEVLAVQVDDRYLNAENTLNLGKAGLITYAHGNYYALGKSIGKFGYSVMKPKTLKKKRQNEIRNRKPSRSKSASK